MRCGLMRLLPRPLLLLVLIISFIFFTCFLINATAGDLWDQYDVNGYMSSPLTSTFHPQLSTYNPPASIPGDDEDDYFSTGSPETDKVIIMARTMHESTLWVTQELPEWKNAIYTVDINASMLEADPTLADSLQTPANKGHEAMAYLTYIIDHYTRLPSILTFLHPHRSGFFEAWHTDTPLHSNVDALRTLNITHVRNQGYVNLRCKHRPGCAKEDYSPNAHVTKKVWSEIFRDTSTPPWSFHFPGDVGQTCCAQFAVSRETVLRRPVGDYKAMRAWLLQTDLPDAKSGRVFEFLWHVIFGMQSVFCPEERTCYCEVYGRC